jgi:hypothetical protein
MKNRQPMIKFFRKTRYALMRKNKTGKYLKYAIGEVVLVVIGIIIALQINEWNNFRITNKKIETTLNTIHNDIIKDSIRINELIKGMKTDVDHNTIMNKRANSRGATLDTLIQIAKYEFQYFWIAGIEYTDDNYESLKSSGLIEIIPDTLKTVLTEFYNIQNYWVGILKQTNIQYRERFDDFTKTYSPSISSTNKEYTLLNNIGWTNVNPRHFYPRLYAVLQARAVLYKNYLRGLEAVQVKSREVIILIQSYSDDKIL